MWFPIFYLLFAATAGLAAESEPSNTKPYDIDGLMDNM